MPSIKTGILKFKSWVRGWRFLVPEASSPLSETRGDVPVSQPVFCVINFENGEHVTNFTPWLMEYFDFKRSLYPHPRVEEISLSLGPTFHSFQPRFPLLLGQSLWCQGRSPGHILLHLNVSLDMPISKESYEPSRFLQGPASGRCLRISGFCAPLCHPGVEALPLWLPAKSHSGCILPRPPPSAETRLGTWTRAVPLFIL